MENIIVNLKRQIDEKKKNKLSLSCVIGLLLIVVFDLFAVCLFLLVVVVSVERNSYAFFSLVASEIICIVVCLCLSN